MWQQVIQPPPNYPPPQPPGPFTYGLCGCCGEMGVCCQTMCCYHCTMSNIANRFDNGRGQMDCMCCCALLVLDCCLRGGASPILQVAYRRIAVQRYNIVDEPLCNSCMMGLCCHCCSACQIQREMIQRQESAGGACGQPGPDYTPFGFSMNNPRHWSTDLFKCECAECCDVCCCGPCVLGYLATQVNAWRSTNSSQPPMPSEPKLDCPTCCGAMCLPQPYGFGIRREIMERFGAGKELMIFSGAIAIILGPCNLCQLRRELALAQGVWPGGVCASEEPSYLQQIRASMMQPPMMMPMQAIPIQSQSVQPYNQGTQRKMV